MAVQLGQSEERALRGCERDDARRRQSADGRLPLRWPGAGAQSWTAPELHALSAEEGAVLLHCEQLP